MPGSILFTGVAMVVYFVVGIKYEGVSLWERHLRRCVLRASYGADFHCCHGECVLQREETDPNHPRLLPWRHAYRAAVLGICHTFRHHGCSLVFR